MTSARSACVAFSVARASVNCAALPPPALRSSSSCARRASQSFTFSARLRSWTRCASRIGPIDATFASVATISSARSRHAGASMRKSGVPCSTRWYCATSSSTRPASGARYSRSAVGSSSNRPGTRSVRATLRDSTFAKVMPRLRRTASGMSTRFVGAACAPPSARGLAASSDGLQQASVSAIPATMIDAVLMDSAFPARDPRLRRCRPRPAMHRGAPRSAPASPRAAA